MPDLATCPRCGQFTLGAPCQCARGAGAPAFDAPRLFDAPATIRGQLAMPDPDAERFADWCTRHGTGGTLDGRSS